MVNALAIFVLADFKDSELLKWFVILLSQIWGCFLIRCWVISSYDQLKLKKPVGDLFRMFFPNRKQTGQSQSISHHKGRRFTGVALIRLGTAQRGVGSYPLFLWLSYNPQGALTLFHTSRWLVTYCFCFKKMILFLSFIYFVHHRRL